MSPFVLIVSAVEEKQEWLRDLIAALGCRVYELPLQAEAAAGIDSARPDLIVLTTGADPATSLTLLESWRSDTRVPVLVVANQPDQLSRAAAWQQGVADLVALPASDAELRARLGLQLTLKQSRDAESVLGASLKSTMAHIEHLRARLDNEGCELRAADAPAPVPHDNAAPLPKILLVDDSPANIHLLVEFLRKDYKTLAATNGPAALRIAQNELPDLILLDVVMPEMDGHEICRQLKNDPRTEPIPIIFITGKNEVEDEMVGFELGAIDYIVKPFSLPLVQRRIRTHVELKHYRDELERQSMLDGMTGIANRRCFDQSLSKAWARAMAAGEALSLIMIDIDHFKAYNDHGGHPAGDACLRRVASALAMAGLRSDDLVARYGGEEFACILPATGIDEAVVVAQRMHAAIADMQIPHPSPAIATLSLSLGVACLRPAAGELASTLVDVADKALYQAKQDGRNRVVRPAP